MFILNWFYIPKINNSNYSIFFISPVLSSTLSIISIFTFSIIFLIFLSPTFPIVLPFPSTTFIVSIIFILFSSLISIIFILFSSLISILFILFFSLASLFSFPASAIFPIFIFTVFHISLPIFSISILSTFIAFFIFLPFFFIFVLSHFIISFTFLIFAVPIFVPFLLSLDQVSTVYQHYFNCSYKVQPFDNFLLLLILLYHEDKRLSRNLFLEDIIFSAMLTMLSPIFVYWPFVLSICPLSLISFLNIWFIFLQHYFLVFFNLLSFFSWCFLAFFLIGSHRLQYFVWWVNLLNRLLTGIIFDIRGIHFSSRNISEWPLLQRHASKAIEKVASWWSCWSDIDTTLRTNEEQQLIVKFMSSSGRYVKE